ncbi:MAG: arylsulfatase [Verrucomicrobia bacterium]|nr:MAG: arylsulfatase [Verrucomicrobiota bacterium]
MRTLRNLIAMLAVLGVWLCAPAPARAAVTAKPNFVVILIDDLGYGDIGPFGSKVNRTPNLDRMAAEGMKLTSFYAAPVCTPSRAQMMTGCYAKRVSMPTVIFPACPTGLSAREATVAGLLKREGYVTMAIGKWHLGDQPEFLPTRRGFDHYLGLPYSNDMGGPTNAPAKPAPQKPTSTAGRPPYPPLPLLRDATVLEAPTDQNTLTARYTEAAVEFITANKDRPFFLYLPHNAVHTPLHPGAAFKGKSANGTYGDWVEEVDWSVGRVLDTLRSLDLAQRTLVLFTSDNGPWLTQGTNGGVAGPLHGGKGTTWEGGVREPTIAWWPGKIPAHSVCDAIMSEMDVLPTFVKLAGGNVPSERKLDGKDVWPLLSGQTKASPHEALCYFNGLKLEAVRAGPWKLAIAPQGTGLPKGAAKPVEHTGPRLYNLDTDIGELADVAAQHPEVVARLQKFVQQMDADLGVTGEGPGVRPPDRVANPQPLLKRVSKEYD